MQIKTTTRQHNLPVSLAKYKSLTIPSVSESIEKWNSLTAGGNVS